MTGDKKWPMSGRPTGSECKPCLDAGEPCYCDGDPGERCACWAEDVPVVEVTRDEGLALFDERVRSKLGISGIEFLEAYDRGDFDDAIREDCCHPAGELAMLIPFARKASDT